MRGSINARISGPWSSKINAGMNQILVFINLSVSEAVVSLEQCSFRTDISGSVMCRHDNLP